MQHYRSTKYWHKLKEKSCFLFQRQTLGFPPPGSASCPLNWGCGRRLFYFGEKMLSSFHLHLQHVLASCFMQSIVPLLKTNIYISNFLVLLSKDPSLSLSPQVTLSERFISKCPNLSQNCSFGNCSPLARATMSWVPMWAWTGLLCSTPGLSQWGGRTRQNTLRNGKERMMPSSKISGWLIRFSP